ncbi:MAG: NAD-dependent protein deacetylase [Wenzhouxiangellaceae bacterium]|nr:NAD-dependent protein deacetylase [Wenzhouxiangellaceae bacterium]
MDARVNGRKALRIPELRTAGETDAPTGTVGDLTEFLARHERIAVLTGAGCSTAAGIPAYRDRTGRWQRRQPIFFQDFIADARMRRRYWARSFFGWPTMRAARPGPAHRALARLAGIGRLAGLITQNVDGLHQRAGHGGVIELHGGLERVLCRECGAMVDRNSLQELLAGDNPAWSPDVLGINPDGDAELDDRAWPGFRVVDCRRCGGMLKPDVVFFGESVPADRMAAAGDVIGNADAVLVVGTSLVVGSAYRIVRRAAGAGLPLAAVNDGRTRADALLGFKIRGDCGEVLSAACPDFTVATGQPAGA